MLTAGIVAGETKANTPSPPSVVLQVVPAQDTAKQGSSIRASVIITNTSATPIENTTLELASQSAGVSIKSIFPKPVDAVPAFGTESREIELATDPKAEFATIHLVFLLKYGWKNNKDEVFSAATTTVNVTIQRQFEEEAKGLPGGTAALLYLILPIMTIFLSYEVTDSLCKGQGLKWPEFKGEYVLPAFLLAIAMNFLLVYEFHEDKNLLYSTPQKLFAFLSVMAAIGALIPLVLESWRKYKWHRFGFRETDTAAEYLRKVLAQFPDGRVQWVTGTQWQGVQLPQPDGSFALGAQIYVSTNSARGEGDPDANALEKVVNADGNLQQARSLTKLVKQGHVTVTIHQGIQDNGSVLQNYVKTVKEFPITNRNDVPVVKRTK